MEKEITIPKGYEAKIEGNKVVFVLTESEDEMAREWILEYLRDGLRKTDEQFKEQFKAAISYLERQKEQKSAWREEDEAKLNRICSILVKTLFVGNKELFELQDWLKSLPERFK